MSGKILSFWAAATAAVLLGGCFSVKIHPTLQERNVSLAPGDLEAHGIAFITPSAATGQEEEKQAVAFAFAETLKEERQRTDNRIYEVTGLMKEQLAVHRALVDQNRELISLVRVHFGLNGKGLP